MVKLKAIPEMKQCQGSSERVDRQAILEFFWSLVWDLIMAVRATVWAAARDFVAISVQVRNIMLRDKTYQYLAHK